MEDHQVTAGECLSSIGDVYGFFGTRFGSIRAMQNSNPNAEDPEYATAGRLGSYS